MIDDVREMTAKKSSKYGRYGLFNWFIHQLMVQPIRKSSNKCALKSVKLSS